MMQQSWYWAAGIAVVVGVGLACAGGGASGGGGFTGGSSAPDAYAGVAWSKWDVRSDDYRWDMVFDETKVTSSWLGDTEVPFEAGASTVGASFAEGAVDLELLDACHMAGRGPHPHKADVDDRVYRMDRTWPPCGPGACTYADLPFTRWHIYTADGYHYYVNFGDDGSMVADWIAEDGAPYSQSGGSMSSTTPKGTLQLDRLDRCHWAGKGPHPKKAGETVTYRLERAWPTCGC